MTVSARGDSAPRGGTRTWAIVAGALYISAILWVTLRPLPWATEGDQEQWGILDPAAWLEAASWTEGRPLEVAFNVAMFLPVGMITGYFLRGPGRVLAPIALTLTIELAQIPLDRISHPRDLVANALGALLGVAVVSVVRRRQSHPAGAGSQAAVDA
jgi:hypothetical protein